MLVNSVQFLQETIELNEQAIQNEMAEPSFALIISVGTPSAENVGQQETCHQRYRRVQIYLTPARIILASPEEVAYQEAVVLEAFETGSFKLIKR